ALFLVGLALGVFLCSALAGRLQSPFATLSALVAAASVGAWASMYLVPQVALLYLNLTPYLSRPGLSQLPAALAAAGLMLPSGIILGAFPASWDPRIVAAGLYRYGARSLARFESAEDYLASRRNIEVQFYQEGRESSVMVERTLEPAEGLPPAEALTLTVDGKVEATTGNDIRTQVLQGHIPILVHGPTESVLQI